MSLNKTRIEAYRVVAHSLHRNQRDKAGKPYVDHIDAVELGVQVLGGEEAERIAALFHDSVEDGHTTLDDLRAIGLTDAEIRLVDALTKRPGETRKENLARIVAASAERVKVADLLNNTRHDRVAALRPIEGDEKVDTRLVGYRSSLATLLSRLKLV